MLKTKASHPPPQANIAHSLDVHGAEHCGVLHSESCEAPAKMGECKWQKFKVENGRGYWWWCEKDSDWFLEEQPGRWVQYVDTATARKYWWRDDETWFWCSC